ncbi:glycoside hydrolase family 1 protein [Caulobacter hibisci]|uniref:Glycoside hydrolase family 1 protein n=1 Tax=Caulobacter hibisci TaxID=2035993 RepID=A0ABS0SYD3_9CAUL|nr:family 1 glycosylhydrolase [Caulobacter hibisci]MBI1683632.1 glycoside hydrolase family 1 protein [Caulobacter hibisci]
MPFRDADFSRRALLTAGVAAAAAPVAAPAMAAGSGDFPKGFLWGAATAGHQVEGNNVNSDTWLLEQLKPSPFMEPSGDACDHYHRYEADIALLAKLGLNTYRFSLEWARIEPAKGQFSAAELEHYRRVALTCRKHGVTPLITFNHFVVPRWFAAQGGWENPESPALFARYCAYAVKGVGDLAGGAATFNEPNIGLLLQWILPPFILDQMKQAMVDAAKACGTPLFSSAQFGRQDVMLPNLIEAHKQGYAAIKAGPGDFPVGATLAMLDDHAVGENSRRDEKRAQCYDPWLKAIKETGDFVGVQTYSRALIDAKGQMQPPQGAELTQTGEEFSPQALGQTVRYAHALSGKSIYVTENGVAIEDDTRRVAYIKIALQGLKAAMDDGIPVKGYVHWSLLDNFEWVFGYGPKFGIVAVDRATQARTPKPSAILLGQIARANRI